MTIEPLQARHVAAVARLHTASLTGFLAALGPRATRVYYSACAGSPACTAFVALEGDEVVGFVSGAKSPPMLKAQAVTGKPFAFTVAVALGVLRRPSVLPLLVSVARGSAPGMFDRVAPELTYLAVAPERRRSGAGRRLVEAFTDAMRRAGAAHYEVSVDADNHAAVRFYEELGFERVGNYREFGIDHRRYRLRLTAPAA